MKPTLIRTSFVLSLVILTVFSSCKKTPSSDNDGCAALQSVHIYTNTPVTIGEKMYLSAPEIGGLRIYSWTGPNNYRNQEPSDSIYSAELKNEGWYYLGVSRNDCSDGVKVDSVYFDVKLQQGTPSCSTPVNTTTYSNLFDDSYSIIKKSISTAYNVLTLSANGSGNMNILFHPVWKTAEPEDGIYITTSTEFFDQTDLNYNKVYVTTTKQSIYWGSQPGQKVYVSHINGKLQARFCNLMMSGNNGTSYTTAASGNILQQ